MAATVLSSVNATTLHTFCGIIDGRYTDERLKKLVRTDERFISIVKTIRETDVLIMDEASMISARVFEQAEIVCRQVNYRQKQITFVVITVANSTYNSEQILTGTRFRRSVWGTSISGSNGPSSTPTRS